MYLIPLNKYDKVDPIWYQMYLSIGFMDVEQNSYQRDLFEACVIREVSGSLLDDHRYNLFGSRSRETLDFTGRAIVGLNVNEVECRDTNQYIVERYYVINIASNSNKQ